VRSDVRDILLGLACAAITTVLARAAQLIHRHWTRVQTARRYPIGGVYISTYTDVMDGVTRVVRDVVMINQAGSTFSGYSRNLTTGRRFNIEGRLVNEKYLTGSYGGAGREDESSGVFYLGLDLLRSGQIRGLWAGYGAESASIISGEWNWRQMAQIGVEECTGSSFSLLPAAATLLNDALGSGYVSTDELQALCESGDGVVLLATDGEGRLEGAATAGVMSETEKADLERKLVEAGVVRPNVTNTRMGLLKTAAVVPHSRGRGIGLQLVNERLARLKQLGCAAVMVLAWDSGSRHSSLGVLEAAGFQRVTELPKYWREPEGQETFDCAKCEGPCECTAVVMRRSLYDFAPDNLLTGTTRGR
jgi:N-acetylglutamate synthase-like GNAT family acetyltransferase